MATSETGRTLWFDRALTGDGWQVQVRLTIADGTIVAVDTGAAPAAGEERHAIGLPGLPNLHSHAFQRGMAGLTEQRGPAPDSFWTWRALMYRFAGRITPDTLQAIAALAYVEMLESGFTRVGEFHYVHHQPSGESFDDPAGMAAGIAAAAAETGIGLTLLPVLYAAAGFGDQPPGPLQRRFVSTIDGFERLLTASEAAVAPLGDAVVGVAPHSLRAVPPAMLAAVATMRPDMPIHIHIAEQVGEVLDCLAWSGQRPIDWLYDHVAVDTRWCLVHATHAQPGEIARMARSGAVVGLCPITEANLGDGAFPAAAFLTAGGSFGIGSDSNVLIDAAGELRTLEYGARLASLERNVLADGRRSTGRTLYDHALAGGAQALGQRGAGLVPGAGADIVALAADHPSLIARDGDALLDSWTFAGGPAMIDRVWRRGREVVRGGRHVARDAIVARYRRGLGSLLDAD